jgi:NAD+ synthase (glutamine-hydrolysing)
MEIALAELAPIAGDVERNVARAAEVVRAAPAALIVFPELYLTGYRVGDRFHKLAIREHEPRLTELAEALEGTGRSAVVGAPTVGSRRGEVDNSVLLLGPDGTRFTQGKRYLPTYGPFEEGGIFSPSESSTAAAFGPEKVGLSICYDAFFPEVFRALALDGANLFVCVSAAPVTSRRLFEKVLPARAVENAAPLVYVNRVGVEDGIVFGGGSRAYDARGEPLAERPLTNLSLGPDEKVVLVDVDVNEPARWRPFRPVLRDVAQRPGHRPSGPTRTTDL